MKRRLCTDIAEKYRQKSEAYKQHADVVKVTRLRGSCPWFSRFVVKPFLNAVGDFYLEEGEEFGKKAEDYERLANSGRVRFMPSIALYFILRKLKDDIKPL
jgi:spore coat polysaccharide biosynthesis protein SpsF (cytidylyltransferase family)